jgi:DNA primase
MSLLEVSEKIQSHSQKLHRIISASQKILHSSNHSEVLELRAYLNSRLSLETQKQFEIGFLPSPENYSFFQNEFLLSDFLETRIFYQQGGIRSLFPFHSLLLPYRDEYGNYVSISSRTLLSEEERKSREIEKYKNLFFNKNQYIFGLYDAKKEILKRGFAFLVEGQFDTYSAHSRGLKNTVGMCGSSFGFHQQFLLRLYTNKLYFLFDSDEAGQKAARKIQQHNLFQFEMYFLSLPLGYKDVDEYFRNHSQEDFYSEIFVTAQQGEKCEILPPTDLMPTNIYLPK